MAARSASASSRSSASAANSLTAALAAAERGDIVVVRRFLSANKQSAVDAAAVDSEGRQSTLLHVAARHGHLDIVRLLIECDCRVNAPQEGTGDTPLMLALSSGHEGIAEELLSHEKCHYDAQNHSGWTALMLASKGGLTRAMEKLLLKGPCLELETADGDGETALTLAVAAGQDEAVQLLLEFGAQAGHRNGSGCTPDDLAWRLEEIGAADDGGAANRRRGSKRRIIEALAQRRRRAPGARHSRLRAALEVEFPDEEENDDAVADDATASRLIGGRYKNLGPLGSGAHGLALLVRDMRSDCGGQGEGSRLKVLKRLGQQRHRRVNDDENRELSLLKRLNHSCVLTLFDYFNDSESNLCLVTEYCELRDLHTWIKWADATDIALPFKLVTHWLLQMLLGLSYLHERRIIHGDFKPSNVFVQSDATLRIGDFGCSLQLAGSVSCKAGSISGTWIYMSPEVISNQGRDTSSDMWSLGCTLYELCTCQPLFDPSLAGPQLREQICGASDRSFELSPLLPPWILAALPRLLHRSPPSGRPAAAALLLEKDVARELEAMQPDLLAEDRQFLADNLAGVLESDDAASTKSVPCRGVDFSQAYDALLADVQRFMMMSSAQADLDLLTGTMTQLEELRAQLEEKQLRDKFPLGRVYDLLSKVEDEDSGSSGVRARQELQKQLAALTKDTEACEMVQLAIMLERQCAPISRSG